MSKIENLKQTYDQVQDFVRLHPRGSATGGVGMGGFLIDLIATHGSSPVTFWSGFFLSSAAAYVTWKHGKDLSAIPVSDQGTIMIAESPMGNIDQQKSDRTWKERALRLFDTDADGPNQPIRGIVKEERYNVQDAVSIQRPQATNEQHVDAVFSQHPDDETLKLGTVVATGQRFDPHINMLFGQGMIASAVQGSGKSMLNGVIIEQAGKCGVPVVVFDHKGEYAPITELPFINGLRAGSAKLRAKIGSSCFELTENNADDFVQLVMTPDENGQYRQAIIHLPSYGDAWVERANIVAAVGQSLMSYATLLREQGIEPVPCLILMDEAQLYIPQNVELLPPEARENKKTLSSLNNAYFSLVSNGRSNGYTVLFATQSLTYIAKWAIKSCQIRVFMRHAEKNDLDMCADIIDRSVATREQIEAFPKGTGVVFGFTTKPMIVHFDKKQSKDESETPGLDRLRKRQQPRQTAIPGLEPIKKEQSKTLDLDAILALAGKVDDTTLLALIDRLPDYDGKDTEELATFEDEEEEESPPSAKIVPILPEKGRMAEEIDINAAIAVYNTGATSRYRLAEVFGLSENQGRKLKEIVEARAAG